MSVLKVNKLCKKYEKFSLENVSFEIEKGRIVGFIGRNGAGKTTTIKSILNFVHPDSGEIEYFGMKLLENEQKIKQRVGYSCGSMSYYQKKKIKDIVGVTKSFFDNWDDNEYRHYMDVFELDEEKAPKELSEGMKVKFNLVLALSHKAELLILDEPTSGLDPVSRDELLDIFIALAKKGVSILFSTHITSDLEKCADDITYIKKGKIISSSTKEEFMEKYAGESLENIMISLEKEDRKQI